MWAVNRDSVQTRYIDINVGYIYTGAKKVYPVRPLIQCINLLQCVECLQLVLWFLDILSHSIAS